MELSISFQIGKNVYSLSPSVINSVIVVLALVIFIFICYGKIKKTDYKARPSGLVSVMETLVTSIDSLIEQTMGKNREGFAPYILSLMMFLLTANLMGLFGFKPPTSDLNVTLTLALITFVLIHYNKIKVNGLKDSIKGYFEPIFILFPINIIGDIALPVSLSFRLFGNIVSGSLIMALVYAALGFVSNLLTPIVAPWFHIYFDVFSGVLQTFIFAMITMIYIAMGMGQEEN